MIVSNIMTLPPEHWGFASVLRQPLAKAFTFTMMPIKNILREISILWRYNRAVCRCSGWIGRRALSPVTIHRSFATGLKTL